MYEALMRLAWISFMEWLESNHNRELKHLRDINGLVEHLQEHTCQTAFQSMVENQSSQRILDLFQIFLQELHNNNGQ